MKIAVLLPTVLLMVGCAATYRPSIDTDGMYRLKGAPFAVWAPVDCVPDIAVYDTDNGVRFTTGRGDWITSGEFEVQVHAVPQGSFEEDFVAKAKEIYQRGLNLVDEARMQSEEVLFIDGKPAYQTVTTDDQESLLIATHIRFPDHVVVVHLGYPLYDSHGEQREVPWACYERFVGSIVYSDGR